MNAHTTMIIFIVVITITIGGIVFIQNMAQSIQNEAQSITSATEKERTADLTLVNTIGAGVENRTFSVAQIQVRYDGNERLSLNDTFIQLRTEKSIADLQYRNGTAERDEINGFYTK